MTTSTLKTNAWGDEIKVTADWAEASNQITGDLEGGRQVAEVGHSPHEALKEALRQYVQHSGDDPDDAEIAAAIEAMVATAEWSGD